MKQILKGMNLPPVVANKRLPLEEQIKAKQEADVMTLAHSAQGRVSNLVYPTDSAVKADNLRGHYSAMFWTVIAPLNNMAIMETKSAFDELKKEPRLYKQAVKRNAKIAMERIDKYDAAIMRTMASNPCGDRSQYWMDYSDEHYEMMRHDLDIFRLSVLNVLARYNIPLRGIKARITTSLSLLDYAVGMFDTFFRKIREKTGSDLSRFFTDARLSYVRDPWEQVHHLTCNDGEDICLNKEHDCEVAFQIIERHAVDIDRINEIGKVAISYNEDVLKNIYDNPLNKKDGFEKSYKEIVK